MSCAQAVAVRRDQRALAGHHGRRDGVVPVGQNASDRVLQALRAWKASWTEIEVARIAGLDPRITFRERGRGDIEGTPPDLDLRFAVAGSRLRLVQSLQRPVMPLVQAPRTVDGNPHPVHLLQRSPQRLDGPPQHRRKRDVEVESFALEQLACRPRFSHSMLGQADVGPSGEAVLAIPDRLTMAQEDELPHDPSTQNASRPA